MALIGKAIKRAITLQKTLARVKRRQPPQKKQENTLYKLLRKAQNTEFGRHYNFNEMLLSGNALELFQERVPIYDYDAIHRDWWYRLLNGEENITWPGAVQYFALSSGTSGAPSKKIPITKSMIRSIRRTSVRQILSLAYYDLPPELFEKGIFMLGGSTDLQKRSGYYEGDLSGINAAQIPFWFQAHYKPGKKIARERDWEAKLDEIVLAAPSWDIGIIVGVPAWIHLAIERIIKHYQVETIHDIWPNLQIYVHGGVFFEPYKKSFEKLMRKPLHYIETYLASEGFIALQADKGKTAMELVLNNGIFFEFIPFDSEHFDASGMPLKEAKALTIKDIKPGVDYALLLSSCAGAWRYLIGDTVRFTDTQLCELIITGRTKHYLSLCGEHLSVDNMNQAIVATSALLGVEVPEYCVSGFVHDKTFGHKWFIGCNDVVDVEKFRTALDDNLKRLNDDYAVERRSALKEMQLEVIPVSVFYDWMRTLGKEGGQNKFPRVLKKEQLLEWEHFISKVKTTG
jgi:hypothetical protein